MAKGFLTMFEDPVVGPQLALGLLSMGTGLLTSGPEGVNRSIQGGLGQISQGMLYGGRLKQKELLKQQKLDERAASAEEFRKRFFGGAPSRQAEAAPSAPAAMSGTTPLSSPYVQAPRAMAPPAGAEPGPPGGSSVGQFPPQVAELIEYSMLHPEAADFVKPLITQLMTPKKATPFQEYLAAAGIPEGSDTARRLALIKAGGAPSIEQTATERYRQQLDEDRNAGLDIQRAGQAQTTSSQAATRALELEKFAYEKSKPPPMTDFDRKAAAANLIPGTPEYMAAAKANLPQPAQLPIEKALALEGIDPGSEEGMAALKKARPGEGSDLLADLLGGGGGGLPAIPGTETAPVAPPPPAPPPTDGPPVPVVPTEPTVAEKVADAVGLGPEPVTPVSTLGEMEDVRLEKRLGPEKAAGLRTMLGTITDPAKQKRASGVLRRVAKGTLGIANAAKELEALGL